MKERKLKFLLPKLNHKCENDEDLVLNFKNLMNFKFNDHDDSSTDNRTRPNTKARPPNRRNIASHAITVDK